MFVRPGKRLLDLPEFEADVFFATNPRQYLLSGIGMTVLGEPAWGLRHAQHSEPEDRAGHYRQPQHPSPPAASRECVVDHVSHQNSDCDGKLEQRDLPAASLRG